MATMPVCWIAREWEGCCKTEYATDRNRLWRPSMCMQGRAGQPTSGASSAHACRRPFLLHWQMSCYSVTTGCGMAKEGGALLLLLALRCVRVPRSSRAGNLILTGLAGAAAGARRRPRSCRSLLLPGLHLRGQGFG